MTFRRHSNACLTGVMIAAFVTAWSGPASAQQSVKPDAIGGKVSGPNGPEAGVWVIAETSDLPTKYAKMVVTNDAGQFVIPQLPSAKYKIWARGYGLVDSDKQEATPGKTIDLTAKPAPNAAAAAEYYPGMYWYAMMKIPPASEFPGSDKSPTGMPASMDSQATWIDSLKNSCQSCHALGSDNIRHPHVKDLGGEFKNSEEMWERRVQSGQAMNNMALTLGRMGPPRAYKMFADWTDRIAAGELPFEKPERPKGLERNVVITSWEWGKHGMYLHDEVSTDKRNPTVNANGKIYGSPEESSDDVPVLDPVKNTTSLIHEPFMDPQTPSAKDAPMAPSPFWGDEAIWDGHTSIHNPMMDEKGRVWFTARLRRNPNPASCQAGSDLPSAQVAPQKETAREASVFDPKTDKWTMIDTCFNTHHLVFTPDDKLWFSQGQPYSGVVGWLDVKKFDATGDAMKSQGWTPVVVNTSGTGKREPFVAMDKPVEPGKDKWVKAAFYGIAPSVKGDVIWGQVMGPGFTRIDQPAWLVRIIPGSDPTHTAVSEIFQSPPGTYGSRGVDVDSKGVAWTVLSSGQLASFDRSKCKEKLEGPNAATGAQCFEGWTLYRMPGPQFKGVNDPQGSANHAYYIWVDVHNTLGLGNDVPIAMANGSESLLALVDGKFVDLRIPYPLGFFSKNADGRIDDPNAGWKGRGLWTTTGTRAYFHSEGGKDAKPRVFKVQMRPDPLAD
jgi:hypothetical protein